jgi:hypothetical protein
MLIRKGTIMSPLNLPTGNHALSDPVLDCEITYCPGHQADVELTASVGGQTNAITPGLRRGQTATTLAFRMDRQVAKTLYVRLWALGHSMGWLPEEEDQAQA